MATISDINQKIIGTFTGANKTSIANSIGWLLVGIIIIGICGWIAWAYFEKKKFNKKVTAYGIIHGHFHKTFTDVAKSIKLGKGGFEVLYLKKLKTWKLAHGARIGNNEYTFYILPDGYWYPGQIMANMQYIDEQKGLLPVVTTNPTMRSQYTSLEKQIDDMHGDKKGFWDKYGTWVLSIAYVLIMGVFVWLAFKEWSQGMSSFKGLTEQLTGLTESMNRLAVNLNGAQPSGLVPAA